MDTSPRSDTSDIGISPTTVSQREPGAEITNLDGSGELPLSQPENENVVTYTISGTRSTSSSNLRHQITASSTSQQPHPDNQQPRSGSQHKAPNEEVSVVSNVGTSAPDTKNDSQNTTGFLNEFSQTPSCTDATDPKPKATNFANHLSKRDQKAAENLHKCDRLANILLEWQQCTMQLAAERDRLRDELAVDQKSREKLVQVSKDQRNQIQALEKALQDAQDAAQSAPKLQLEILNLKVELAESRQVLAQEKETLVKQGRESMREEISKEMKKLQSVIDAKEAEFCQLKREYQKTSEKFEEYKATSESAYTKLQLAHDKQTQLLTSHSVAGSQLNMANIYRKKIQEQKIEIRRLQQGSRK
eukprot:m.932680 g.932680  ORF g.932680 m.932680 type:complete len:360 (-) comp23792_c0_seq1:3887-4966(-)